MTCVLKMKVTMIKQSKESDYTCIMLDKLWKKRPKCNAYVRQKCRFGNPINPMPMQDKNTISNKRSDLKGLPSKSVFRVASDWQNDTQSLQRHNEECMSFRDSFELIYWKILGRSLEAAMWRQF